MMLFSNPPFEFVFVFVVCCCKYWLSLKIIVFLILYSTQKVLYSDYFEIKNLKDNYCIINLLKNLKRLYFFLDLLTLIFLIA